MYKMDEEKAEESICQHLLDHRKEQGNLKKITSASLTILKTDSVMLVKKQQLELDMEERTGCR